MARKPMVTRSFSTTTYHVMAVNTDTATVEELDITLTRKIDDKKLLATLSASLPTNYSVVKILSHSEDSKVYGMDESEFIKYASIIER